MKFVFRLIAAMLLVCPLFPQHVQAGGDMGRNPYEIGEKFFARKEYGKALHYYRKALRQNDVRSYYRMGLIDEAAGKDRDALSRYRRFIDLGQSGAERSDAVARVKTVEARLQKRSARSSELLERGKSLFQKGNYRQAEAVLLQASAMDKSEPEIHFYLGEVYMKLEAFGKATSEYKKAKGYY